MCSPARLPSFNERVAGLVVGKVSRHAPAHAAPRALRMRLALLAQRACVAWRLLRRALGEVHVVGVVARASAADALCVLHALPEAGAPLCRWQNLDRETRGSQGKEFLAGAHEIDNVSL